MQLANSYFEHSLRETITYRDFGVDLQRRMRGGFLQLAKEFPDRIRIVNGNQSVEDLSEEIYGVVQETLL